MAPKTARLSSKDTSFSAFSQLTYELPHSHIYTSQFYPRSLQSRPTTVSEVLICAHESGLTILWRAKGTSKKPSKDASSGKQKAIARDDDGDDMMILDGPPSKKNAINGAETEEQPEPADEEQFACSYTVHLGTPVHHISFPPASILPSDLEASRGVGDDDEEDSMSRLPNDLLQKNFLIVATCADRSVRLITLPRAPPSSSQSTKKREHVIVLGTGIYGHKEVPSAVSVTIVPSANSSFSHENSERRTPSGSPGSYSPPRLGTSDAWDILIASSSADTNGLILLWRISLHPPPRKSSLPVTFKTPSRPINVFLHAPATSLSFNTSPTSKSRRQHLLVVDRKGAVRILDTRTKSWLGSFYTSFSRTSDRRKKILGAEWLTGGRGIIVLCEDGEWGVWDLEGVLSKLDEASVTGFFIGGVVGETWYNNRKSHSNHYDESVSEISGRSPSNRAMSVMSGGTGTTIRRRRGSSARDMTGGIGFLTVTAIPGSSFFSSTAVLDKGKTTAMGGLQINDETITFVFGSVVMVIPSLKKFWRVEEAKMQKRSHKSGTLGMGLWNGEDGKAEKEFIVLEGWNCGGATVTGVDVIPPGRTKDGEWDGDSVSTPEGNVARILLGTSCRIVIMDVKESSAVAAIKDSKTLAVAVASATGAASNRRAILPKANPVPGTSSKGKRKVGFLQDS
ncbi:uncharacterized protein LAJ45_04169 [Morchella importuna]|uniref:uncharacterized protein n=1 Tax=Morchella importuna TaxID=1174673 RepID=UPI001E8CE376|nr:uncharacterized protein LAJ45_04169 [Morchella importuna]KAH8151548.1 hypothetical protein LAJ45_04169 [Morchella importuna]